MSETVLLERRGPAFWITLNRPDKRNALNQEVLEGIREGYARAQADPDVRVLVLTGAGDKAFCAGADLDPGQAFSFDYARPNGAYADLLRLSQQCTLPSIARVNGVCMAGGMGLVCMTDFAIAADDAQFGLPEVKVGLFPMQVLSLLKSLVPPRVLREWCLSGTPFNAEEARRWGLINHVVARAELDARTQMLIDRLAGNSPTAIRRGKYVMRSLASMSFDEAIAHAEGQIALLALTEDAKEGMRAFNEKRKPVWTGR